MPGECRAGLSLCSPTFFALMTHKEAVLLLFSLPTLALTTVWGVSWRAEIDAEWNIKYDFRGPVRCTVFNCLCVNASSASVRLLLLVLFQINSKQYDCSKEGRVD